MIINISQRPGSSMAKVILSPGEHLTTEAGSMVAMSTNVTITTTTYRRDQGNIFGALKRVMSGESFFLNHYTAPSEGGEVWIAPTLPGDMVVHELNGDKIIVQSGSYVASADNINVDFNWQGFKSFLSGENIFWLEISGQGKVLLNSFGVIYPVEVDGEYIVDTGHIVAFEETLNFTISKAGKSWLSSFLGGEGFVCKFRGKGTVWCQSHNAKSFGLSIGPNLKPRN